MRRRVFDELLARAGLATKPDDDSLLRRSERKSGPWTDAHRIFEG
jgi:hypothetical protein